MKISKVIKLTLNYNRKLSQLLVSNYWVEDISAEKLKSMGAEAVILDHDGVLGANFSLIPDNTGKQVISEMLKLFGPGKVFILSNTKSAKESRAKAFSKELPEVIYIRAEKKPGPGGLHIASKLSGVPVSNIAVVDDGILTGILMAVSAGAMPVYAKRKKLAEGIKPKITRLATTGMQRVFLWLITIFKNRRN